MPTYERTERFRRDFANLSPGQRAAFRRSVRNFVADLEAGRFRRGLRVKGVKGAPGVFEMTWADDGRATFQYGAELIPGQPHVIWRRCGGHGIFASPSRTARLDAPWSRTSRIGPAYDRVTFAGNQGWKVLTQP